MNSLPNKLWIYIIAIILISALTTGIILYIKNPTPVTSKPQVVQEVFQPVQVKLTLIPEKETVARGEEFIYQLEADPGKQLLIGLETYFYYDPKTIAIKDITPGTLMKQGDILQKNIDATTGKISFMVGSLTPISGTGIAATISIKALAPITDTKSVIYFDKQNTKMAVSSADKKHLYSAKETIILFDEKPITITP